VVGGDADVFKDKGADDEAVLIGEGIEGGADTRSHGSSVEAVGEVDGGTVDRGRAKRAAQELHVEQLVVGDLLRIGLDGGSSEGDLAAAGDRAGAGANVRARETGAGGRAKIELRFQVLEVEGEIEDVEVAVARRRRGGSCDGDGAGTAARRHGGDSGRAGSDAQAGEEVPARKPGP
jgi:hypothetical protein